MYTLSSYDLKKSFELFIISKKLKEKKNHIESDMSFLPPRGLFFKYCMNLIHLT